jgi:hypothetical protein
MTHMGKITQPLVCFIMLVLGVEDTVLRPVSSTPNQQPLMKGKIKFLAML